MKKIHQSSGLFDGQEKLCQEQRLANQQRTHFTCFLCLLLNEVSLSEVAYVTMSAHASFSLVFSAKGLESSRAMENSQLCA